MTLFSNCTTRRKPSPSFFIIIIMLCCAILIILCTYAPKNVPKNQKNVFEEFIKTLPPAFNVDVPLSSTSNDASEKEIRTNYKQFHDNNFQDTLKMTASSKICFLVTGAAGYIGSHMVLHLLDAGYRVIGIDNLSRGSNVTVKYLSTFSEFIFEFVDLGLVQDVQRIMSKYKQVSAVFHFAGNAFVGESVEYPRLYAANITQNTRHVVDAMLKNGISPLVYSSSCSVYGNPEVLPVTETTPLSPLSPYAVAKADAEAYIRSKISYYFQAHIMRYFNVVGADPKNRLGENPRPDLAQYGRLWTSCVDAALGRQQCVFVRHTTLNTPDGSAIRDYIHVQDLVRAHLAVLSANLEERVNIWNVGRGKETSVLEFVRTARRVSGSNFTVCTTSTNEQGHSQEAVRLVASSKKLQSMTGWVPEFVHLDIILETAWKYVLSRHSPRLQKTYFITTKKRH